MKNTFTRFALMMVFALICGTGSLLAQGTVKGTVVDSESGEALAGATVLIEGTSRGSFTDFGGDFKFSAPAGNQTLVIRYVGYQDMKTQISVSASGETNVGEVGLVNNAIGVDDVEILASLARDRQTPVAVSSIDAKTIEEQLSNKEFPEILRSTPSIYTTRSGGGFGDARINVRGFDQRNTAVLINGIPVNDMENGWVYWSNWAGLSDVTRTIQVQRGLGASKLAINSVGGTINIVTKTTDMKAGGTARFTVGNDGYMKFGATASTGRLDNGFAVTLSGSRTTGRGYVDATWIDAWNYFGSIAKDFGEKHQLVFTAVGAPQRHGQRTFMENVTNYVALDSTQDYEEMIKSSTTSDFDERQEGDGFMYSSRGNLRYNSDWGVRDGEVFSVRENFYHKPQLALNHYWTVNDDVAIQSSAYYSVGRGGGSGDRGSIGGRGTWGYRDADGIIRIDDIISWNMGTDSISGFPDDGHYQDPTYGYVATERTGLIKRASMNEHNWFGVLSTANIKLNEKMNLIGGLDLRSYTGLHYRRVMDLMGNDYWLESRDVNQQEIMVDADGDGNITNRETGFLINHTDRVTSQSHKVNYDNDGRVGWQGLFAQLEVTPTEDFNFFVAASASNTSYQRVDRFNYLEGTVTTDTSYGETSERFNFLGYNAKAGGNYNINKHHNVYVNGGLYSRAPTFDNVFPIFTNEPNTSFVNEKVFAAELGYGARYKLFDVNVNLYRTTWIDKTFSRRYQTVATGDDFTANITGLNAVHQGIEIDGAIKPVSGLTIRGMLSLGDWAWQNNVDAVISDANDVVIDTVSVFAQGLKVGDAAQTTAALGLDYKFNFGLKLFAQMNYAANLYANFSPETRTAPDDEGVQAYKLPAYMLWDAGVSYNIDFDRFGLGFNVNVNNVFDELYIQEARDDPSATALSDLAGYFGFGRTWTAGVVVRFQ